MSVKRGVTKSRLVAKLVTEEKGPCAFCQRDVDDELIYGKLYAIGNIKCHYFCVLLSCCMVQKGRDEDGLFGFLYPDILAEIERSKKHKCSYCNKEGASLGCSVSQCRKQFHLPCGRDKNAVSLFYGSYKSFCQNHTPKPKIADDVMTNAKLRLQADRRKMRLMKDGVVSVGHNESSEAECVCVICYEPVQGYPTIQTFWPPCCARDAWFHRTCVQRMALSAGMHYLKCPLCNDKENFYDAVISQGYYVPDRDAAWELEQNAFADIYERPTRCGVEVCQCPMGREHDSDFGSWDIKLCLVCGSSGAHVHCMQRAGQARLLCAVCRDAQRDIDALADTIEAVIATEQAQIARAERRPVMPSRMSLRRTKQRVLYNSASTSRSQETTAKTQVSETASSREELDLKTPKRLPDRTHVIKDIQTKFQSPSKMLQHLYEKISVYDVDKTLVEQVNETFRKPKPLSVKKKIIDNLLDNILSNITKENSKSKESVKEWCSPKKTPENISEISPQKILRYSPSKTPAQTPKKNSQSPNKSPNKMIKLTYQHDKINFSTKSPIKDSDSNKTINNIIENNDTVQEKVTFDDESSNSTFQLPPEFIADGSNNSLPIFETPKLKTVDIEKDSSLEISENDQVVNVNVIKMEKTSPNNDFIMNLNTKTPVKTEKCAFRFSPLDNETLEKDNVGFDFQRFKDLYLNEVGCDFKCKFKHNHGNMKEKGSRLKTAIDFAIEASSGKKRSLEGNDDVPKKKQKIKNGKKKKVKNVGGLNRNFNEENTNIELSNGKNNLKLSFLGRKKKKTKVSIKDKEIKVKIQWKKKRMQVKITESNTKQESPKLKQYVLKYKDVTEPVLEKPQFDVTPMKRKYVKQEKSPDNLKQTSIQSFFKLVNTVAKKED